MGYIYIHIEIEQTGHIVINQARFINDCPILLMIFDGTHLALARSAPVEPVDSTGDASPRRSGVRWRPTETDATSVVEHRQHVTPCILYNNMCVYIYM